MDRLRKVSWKMAPRFRIKTDGPIKKFAIISGISVFVTLLTLIFVWVLFIPDGDLLLAVRKNLEDHELEIRSHFVSAVERTNEIAEHRILLSFTIDQEIIANPTPGMGLESGLKLGYVLRSKVKIGTKSDRVMFDTEFEIVNIMEKLYSALGFHDYYVIISDYDEEEGEQFAKDVRMTVNIHPVDDYLHPIIGYGQNYEE